MYKINDIIVIIDNDIELTVKIIKINLDGTFIVKTDKDENLRIYRDDIKE